MIYVVIAVILMVVIEAIIIIPDKLPGIKQLRKKVKK